LGKLLENHTLHSGTYLDNPFMAVPPPPRGYFATGMSRASTETQSIGIHEVHLFNTELAMHCRPISNMAVFGCFMSGERLCCHVLAYISRVKSKTGPE